MNGKTRYTESYLRCMNSTPPPVPSASYLHRSAISRQATLASVRWPSYIAVALGVVLFTSTIAMLPQMMLFWQTGVRSGLAGGIGFRLFREGSWALTLILFAGALFYGKIRPHGYRTALLATVCIGLCALSVVVWSSVVKDVNILVQILGLRLLTYVPAVWIGYVLMKASPERSMRVLDKALLLFLAVQLFVCIVQNATNAGALYNSRNVIGVRSFGTFANVNQFAAVTVGAAVLLLATYHVRSRRKTLIWLGICFVLAVMSGSRTGMVTTLFVLAFAWLDGTRVDAIVRGFAYTISPVLVLAGVVYMGSEAFTGRENSDPFANNRLVIWSWLGDTISGPGELLLGDGLGYSTTAYNMLGNAGYIDVELGDRRYAFTSDVLTGNTHSTWVTLFSNFGIGGPLLFGWLLVAAWKRAHHFRNVIVVGVILVTIPKSLVESFPAIFLVYLALGIVLAVPPIQKPLLPGPKNARWQAPKVAQR